MPIKAIVIDDEEDARDILTRLLNRHGNIDIAGKAMPADGPTGFGVRILAEWLEQTAS